mmetsp:Transcript_4147/g.10252  ORF Transcript_4147/g.10252 Transcript_4147/m.10252 type:complete len:153 (+) Transcript_4147:368-826(+)
MLRWAIPCEADEDTEKRRLIRLDFHYFTTGSGFYGLKFNDDLEKLPANHILCLHDVCNWVETTGGHDFRLAWFLLNAPTSTFFLEIAKPLLSTRITGSKGVEKMAKYFKNLVITDERGAMMDGRGEVVLRAGLNLSNLHEATKIIRKGPTGR